MYHKQRCTPEKIKLQLEWLAPLVYIKRKHLPSFRYRGSELERFFTLTGHTIHFFEGA
jgi:hypothetical protein